jgi:hypothetical protein
VQLTPESRAALEAADDVLYLVTDPSAELWFQRLVPQSRSLHTLYRVGKDRGETYTEMVETILAPLRDGRKVCVAFYGHPGVFVHPSHEAIGRARAEGIEARMLPAVSAEDCLFSDLGIDPGRHGCQSYEATDFLIHGRTVDPSAYLVLWQIAFLGNVRYSPEPGRRGLPVLVEYLERWYPHDHGIVLYEASPYPVGGPAIERVALSTLTAAEVPPMSTLVVPPAAAPRTDRAMIERLGMLEPAEDLSR